MRKIKFVDDGQPSLFDENLGAASASVSGGRFAPTANKAAPCQFNKKLSAFEYIALSRTYGVSDDDLKEAKNKLALQSKWLESQEYISDVTGELRTFLDFTMSANHSKKYYAEVWNRTNTISDFMLNHNHRIAFLTITLNGCFRRALNGDYSRFKSQDEKKLSPEFFEKKLKNEPCSIKDLVDLLNYQWLAFVKRFFSYLKGAKHFYIRAFEPHKDGVPHIHALISYPKEIHEKVLQAYKDIFNAPQNLKSTYLSKEQVKNIDKEINIYFVGYSEDNSTLDLARQYTKANDKIKVEAVTATDRPDLVEKYGIETDSEGIIVESGSQYKVLASNDLYTYDSTTYESINVAEEKLTAAIKSVAVEELPKVYFLSGYS